jgi:hypothetical protein
MLLMLRLRMNSAVGVSQTAAPGSRPCTQLQRLPRP